MEGVIDQLLESEALVHKMLMGYPLELAITSPQTTEELLSSSVTDTIRLLLHPLNIQPEDDEIAFWAQLDRHDVHTVESTIDALQYVAKNVLKYITDPSELLLLMCWMDDPPQEWHSNVLFLYHRVNDILNTRLTQMVRQRVLNKGVMYERELFERREGRFVLETDHTPHDLVVAWIMDTLEMDSQTVAPYLCYDRDVLWTIRDNLIQEARFNTINTLFMSIGIDWHDDGRGLAHFLSTLIVEGKAQEVLEEEIKRWGRETSPYVRLVIPLILRVCFADHKSVPLFRYHYNQTLGRIRTELNSGSASSDDSVLCVQRILSHCLKVHGPHIITSIVEKDAKEETTPCFKTIPGKKVSAVCRKSEQEDVRCADGPSLCRADIPLLLLPTKTGSAQSEGSSSVEKEL